MVINEKDLAPQLVDLGKRRGDRRPQLDRPWC
jgi:hypothetical protein